MVVTRERKKRRPDDGELAAKVRQELKEAREQMARGDYVTHEEIMAKYG